MGTEEQPNDKGSDTDIEVEVSPQENDNVGSDNEDNGWRVSEDIYIPPPPQVFGEYDTKGPRLMLVRIVARNFKSYAGDIEIGPFHKVSICFSILIYKLKGFIST